MGQACKKGLTLTSLSEKEATSSSYVRSEYIGTLGCRPSPKLYGKWLNKCKGFRLVLRACKPIHNIGEGNFTRETGVRRETVTGGNPMESAHFEGHFPPPLSFASKDSTQGDVSSASIFTKGVY